LLPLTGKYFFQIPANEGNFYLKAKTAVFLAAGVGSRLQGHIDDKPKGFIEIEGKPIIKRSIDILLKNGIEKIIIGTGFKSAFYEKLADSCSRITCIKNMDFEKTGSFYTLYNMRNAITENFLLLESDLLFEERAVRFLQEIHDKNVILASGWTHSGDEFYIEVDDYEKLVNMSKNREQLNSTDGELVGISKISHSAFQVLCKWAENNSEKTRIRDYEYCLVQMAKSVTVSIKKIEDLLWVEIDDISHLNRALHRIYPKIKELENG